MGIDFSSQMIELRRPETTCCPIQMTNTNKKMGNTNQKRVTNGREKHWDRQGKNFKMSESKINKVSAIPPTAFLRSFFMSIIRMIQKSIENYS